MSVLLVCRQEAPASTAPLLNRASNQAGPWFESSLLHQSVAARRRFPGAAPNTHVLAPSRPVDLVSGFSHSASTDVMAVLSLHPEITFPRKRRPT